jgi:D-3-phosphoglycerate dehydrogenase
MLPLVDYLTLHVPLIQSTWHLIDARRLAMLKPGVVLVNTARGAVVEEAALIEALGSGRLAGAGIDVYEREPVMPDHPLCHLDNVILTSHGAWYSEEAQLDVKTRAAQAAADVFLGRLPQHVINPEVLEMPNARWRG